MTEQEATLKKINNELKGYINEAKFVSNKCRNKILKILASTFSVNIPLENFANIDVELTSNGDIIMRGDRYKTTSPISSNTDLINKYNEFKIKADKILKKSVPSYKTKQDYNNAINLLIIAAIIVLFIILVIHTIISFLNQDYFHCIWLFIFMSSWLIPKLDIKERFQQARNYLKRKFKK